MVENLMTKILPLVALVLAVLYVLVTAIHPTIQQSFLKVGTWRIPATVCVFFSAWSFYTVYEEGLAGFVTLHATSATGTQVWCDLLIAIGIGWTWLMPKARNLNMNILGWAIFVVCTGCVGLSAMLARVYYLEEEELNGGTPGEQQPLIARAPPVELDKKIKQLDEQLDEKARKLGEEAKTYRELAARLKKKAIKKGVWFGRARREQEQKATGIL